jgi:prepilin-type processing-associated H-X9-DG protein
MATYGMNALLTQLGASDNSKFFNSGKFLSPARTMLISSGESGNQQWFGTTVAPWKSPTHTDGTIEVLYADGHAEAMPLEDWPTTPGPRESDAWYFWNAIEGN